MTKHLARYLAALAFLIFLPGLAWAQSSPGLYNGQVPTAAQWNLYFQKKADWPIGGFCADGSVFANITGATNSLRCTPASSLPAGAAATAAKWATARTLTVTGDVALTIAGIDGSANFTGGATLPNVNSNVGSFTCANFTVNAKGLITAAASGACTSGTVTSVGVSLPATFSCSGSPVTASGTITCSYASQSANLFLASPNGGSGALSARAIVNADLPATAVTPGNYTSANVTVNAQGLITAAANGSGGGGASSPQGRLTLVSATPVMTSDQTAKSQVYYDCYVGKQVPYYDGSTDQTDSIVSCEVSLIMATSGTGVTNSGGVFDIYWVHSGANHICVVTNGSGGGWASDTGGSNTGRGSGYSAVHNTRGYWTNTGTLTHCYNGTTDYGSVSADQGTYLGTLYTTAAGQTGMQFQPAAVSGGTNSFLGLCNAYNRVTMSSLNRDAVANWTYSSQSWGPWNSAGTGSGLNNRISYVDCLGTLYVNATLSVLVAGGGTLIAASRDSSTATPLFASQSNVTSGLSWEYTFPPSPGFHFIQAQNVSQVGSTQTLYGTDPVLSNHAAALSLNLAM